MDKVKITQDALEHSFKIPACLYTGPMERFGVSKEKIQKIESNVLPKIVLRFGKREHQETNENSAHSIKKLKKI